MIRFDDQLCYDIQYAEHVANEIIEKVGKEYAVAPFSYCLTYLFDDSFHHENTELLKKIYIFRKKLTSVVRFPDKRTHFLKIVKRDNDGTIFIDDTIYESFLNSMRSILFLKNECIYFNTIVNELKKAISGNSSNWIIKAIDSSGNDVSNMVINALQNNQKAIRKIMKNPDFDFLYNGVFQHNSDEYRDRQIKEIENGTLIVTQYKCALLAYSVRKLLLSITSPFDDMLKNNKRYLI